MNWQSSDEVARPRRLRRAREAWKGIAVEEGERKA